MPTWILYALLSMAFAGLTSVIAKFGLSNAPSDVALTVRTSAVFGFVWLNAVVGGQLRLLGRLTRADLWVLVASGADHNRFVDFLLPRHPDRAGFDGGGH